jgi:nitrogenase molybdenum-iron protein alpha/beta subunit
VTPPSAALEAFALKAHHYGRISGVSLASHAVRDAFLLLHSGVGCKYKAAAQISTHDWGRQPHRREGWTEVGDAALVRGAAARVGPYVRSWYDRQQPGLILVCSASHLEMTGEDIAAAVREAGTSVPCPVRYVPGFGFDGDLYSGYAAVLAAVLELVPWSSEAPKTGHVSVVGYPFDRYEADHTANLHQLASLLGELGLTLDAVLLSGQPLARLQRAARSSLLIALPTARSLDDALAATGREVVHTGLPLGLRGTRRWLQAVGQAAGVAPRALQRVTSRLERYARRELTPLRERVLGSRVALFADTPSAVGLAGFLEEVGLAVRLVGLRDRTMGGVEAFTQDLQALGATLRPDAEVWADPSLLRIRHGLGRLVRGGELAAVLGSAAEMRVLEGLDPQGGGGRDPGGASARGFRSPMAGGPAASRSFPAAGRPPLARLTVGFPATGYHVIHPLPSLGYGGAVALGQRLLDALFAGQIG